MIGVEEREAREKYIEKHGIDVVITRLTEKLLTDRPATGLHAHLAEQLQLEMHGSHEESSKSSEESSELPVPLLRQLFETTKRIIAEILPEDTIKIIINETLQLLSCDRVSLFVYDKRINMLVLNTSNLEHPIRVKPGQGISGHVFTTREILNIPDCYAHEGFDQTFDRETGYHTRNLLTVPIVDFEGECMGVLQAINKLEASRFDRVDEIVLKTLTQHVSIALRNAEIYRSAIVTNDRSNALLHMINSLSRDLGVQSVIFTITMHANQLVQADRCSVFLVDEGKKQLWSVATDSGEEIRIPKNAGIAGQCATEGILIAIPDAYSDPRFNKEIDIQTGYRTQSVLAVPVKPVKYQNGLDCAEDNRPVLAVIQMINKTEFDGEVGKFDDEDIQVMEMFALFVGSRIEGSSLFSTASEHVSTEGELAFDKCRPREQEKRASCGTPRNTTIMETLEED